MLNIHSPGNQPISGSGARSALLVNQFFWPDVAATAQLLSDLADDLADAGIAVRALAGRSAYTGAMPGTLAAPLPAGVEVDRVPAVTFGRGRVRRLASYGTFLAAAALAARFRQLEDVAVCLSTPPFVALVGLLAQRRGARFVYKVEDLYPDVAIALGQLAAGSPLARLLRQLSRELLSRADAVVALHDGMAAHLRAHGARNVHVIPNWADGNAIRPDAAARAEWRSRLDVADRRVVLYSGNLGMAHCFEGVVEAARRLAVADARVLFLFVGAGARLAEAREGTADLPNVRFLPPQPRSALNGLYNAADVHLVTLREEVADLLWPSKYPAALAAGKPVLLVGATGSSMAREIDRSRLGAIARNEGVAVCNAIATLFADDGALAAMGRSARERFEQEYSRERCCAAWVELLRTTAATC